jgi:hypothetical protein
VAVALVAMEVLQHQTQSLVLLFTMLAVAVVELLAVVLVDLAVELQQFHKRVVVEMVQTLVLLLILV